MYYDIMPKISFHRTLDSTCWGMLFGVKVTTNFTKLDTPDSEIKWHRFTNADRHIMLWVLCLKVCMFVCVCVSVIVCVFVCVCAWVYVFMSILVSAFFCACLCLCNACMHT